MNKLNVEKNRISASHPIEYTIGNTIYPAVPTSILMKNITGTNLS